MTSAVLFALPGNEAMAEALAQALGIRLGELETRRFPDGETYLRLATPVADRDVVLVCTLDRPDGKFLPLLFAAATARDLGAARVGLVCPYLPYMRQDRRFHRGEAVTSSYFATAIGRWLDWLVTVDPHLHRRHSLAEIYAIPAAALHAAPLISEWIRREVREPLLVGPDSESEQWVASVAAEAGAPYVVLEKVRRGDRDVEVSVPEVERWAAHTPVLVDDIISTARTMIETVRHLEACGMRRPVCIGVHGVFADDAFEALLAAGVERVVTCNTVFHPSNGIGVEGLLADATRRFLAM